MLYTVNIYVKFALIIGGILGGIALWAAYGFWYGFLFLLLGIAMLASYLLLGTIQSAASMMQTHGIDEAEERLGLTFFPKLLYTPNRAYRHFLRGTFAMQRKDYETAEAELHLAQGVGLPSDNEKAMALLQLANIRAVKGNFKGAEVFIRQAKELKVTEPMLKEQLKEFESAVKQQSSANTTMMRQGFRGFQGGNRRPKMR